MRHPIRILLLLTFFVGLYFLFPLFFGVLTQHYSTQFLKNENDTLGKVLGVHLRFDQYHRGWFHSDAQLQLERQNDQGDWIPFRTIPVNITHGPVLSMGNEKIAGMGSITLMNVGLDEHSPYQFNIQDIIRFNGDRATIVLINNPTSAITDDLKISSLVMHLASNLRADQFRFDVLGKDIHFVDPSYSLSTDMSGMDLNLQAQYLQDRHWKMTLGAQFQHPEISFVLSNQSPSKISINASQLNLLQLHFDTKQIAKLLGELAQMEDTSDVKKPAPSAVWMALFQQLLVQIIHHDTIIQIHDLQAKTPTGELHAQYDISFPALLQPHDYFDIATHAVSHLKITIPSWNAVFPEKNKQFSLHDFQYIEKNNSIFSRETNLSLNTMDLTSVSTPSAPFFYLTKLFYNGESQGSKNRLSLLSNWSVSKLCFTRYCFNQLNGKATFLNLNFDAFRKIAAATQQLVQYDQNQNQSETVETKWADLANAYAKLISQNSSVHFSHQMQTPNGVIQMTGDASWPGLQPALPANNLLTAVMDQSVYQLHLLFPSIYVDQFLKEMHQKQLSSAPSSPAPAAQATEPSLEMQWADFLQYALQQGYLKKIGGTYQSDISGKGVAFTINGIAWKTPA